MASPIETDNEVSRLYNSPYRKSSQFSNPLMNLWSQIFENLRRKADPKLEEERIKVANERERTYVENNLRRLEDLVWFYLKDFRMAISA